MPFSSEPIFHDRQENVVDGPIVTTSTTFVDIPGSEIITADLGETGRYQVWLSLSVQQSNNNTSITFRAVINGVGGNGRTVDFGPNASNEPQHATLIGQAENIEAGTSFKIQWSVSSGTGQINNFTEMLDGIPESRVIPPPPPEAGAILKEDGGFLLKEDGGKILKEQ